MKKIVFGLVGFVAVVVMSLCSQEYKSRQPYPSEVSRIAGLSEYIQDGPRENISYPPPASNNAVVVLSPTNSTVVFRSVGYTSITYFVYLPDCTNYARQVFTLVSADRTTLILTNANLQTFSDRTNSVGAATAWTANTNQTHHVFSTGTNWFVRPD